VSLPAAALTQAILAAAKAGQSNPFAIGVVTASPDGGPITVTWGESVVEASRLDSYAPSVGDVVFMARPTNQLVILGRIV
jgi:hypothetical protein